MRRSWDAYVATLTGILGYNVAHWWHTRSGIEVARSCHRYPLRGRHDAENAANGDGEQPDVKPYNVAVRRFDIGKGPADGVDFLLPLNSPSAFSKKVEGGKPLPLAFTCLEIETR